MTSSRWPLLIGGILLLILVYGLYAVHKENESLKAEVASLTHLIQERPIELATFMVSYERFGDKLLKAGAAQNWELAAFYYEELEETAKQLEKLNLIDDGLPVSQMMRANLLEPLEAVEKAIKAQNTQAFSASMAALITSCNNCHKAAGKPYIQLSLEGHTLRQQFDSRPQK